MADDAFKIINRGIENLVPLAMKKYQMDMDESRWQAENTIRQGQFDMQKQEFAQKVDNIKKENAVKQNLLKLLTPQSVTSEINMPKPSFTPQAGGLMDTDTRPAIERMNVLRGTFDGAQSLPLGEGLGKQTITTQTLATPSRADFVKAHLDAGVMPPNDLMQSLYMGAQKPASELMKKLVDIYGDAAFTMTPEAKLKGMAEITKAEEEAKGKTDSIEQLTRKALTGDKASQAVLDAMEKRQTRIARAGKEGGGLPGGIPSVPVGVKDGSALAGLSPEDQSVVKAIAEYRFPVTNLRNKNMMALVKRAYAYDPTFDAKEYATRAGVRKDFTSGKASQTILSLNTAVGHLNSLAKAANDLDNGSVQKWNQFRNALTTGLTDDARVTKFNTTANAVAGELATVFKNTSGTDQEIKSWHDKISSSQTPGQLKANIKEAIDLIGSRLHSLHNKYEQGMGKKADFQILSPKSRQILRGLGVDMNQFDPEVQTGTTGATMATKRPPLSSFQR